MARRVATTEIKGGGTRYEGSLSDKLPPPSAEAQAAYEEELHQIEASERAAAMMMQQIVIRSSDTLDV